VDHATLRELAAGAALDDLDPGEALTLERHLPECPSCRSLSADLDQVVGELALAAPALLPPAGLRDQVLDALHAPSAPALAVLDGGRRTDRATAGGASSTTVGSRPAGANPRIARWGGLAAAAVFAFAAIGLGAQNRQLDERVTATAAQLADAQARLQARQAAVALVADPAHLEVALHAEPVAPAAQAVVMFRPGTTESYLLATNLPATRTGQVYQLWYADASGIHPLGTFHHDGQGPFVAPFGVDLGSSAAAMVTLEPVGGAVGEPGPQVVFGEF
jgi:hypothetical protein